MLSAKEKLDHIISSLNSTMGEHYLMIYLHMGCEDKGTAKLSLNWKCCILHEIEFDSWEKLLSIVEKTCAEEGVDLDYGTWKTTWVPVDKTGNHMDNEKTEQVECYRFRLDDTIFDNNFSDDDDIDWFYDIEILKCEKV